MYELVDLISLRKSMHITFYVIFIWYTVIGTSTISCHHKLTTKRNRVITYQQAKHENHKQKKHEKSPTEGPKNLSITTNQRQITN